MKLNLLKNLKKSLFILAASAVFLSAFTACSPSTSTPGTNDQPANVEKPAVPGPVTNLRVRTGNESLTVSWTNPKAKELTAIQVYFGNNDSSLSLAAEYKEAPFETSLKKEGLANGTAYYFRVDAIFGEDEEGTPVIYQSAVVNGIPSALPSSVEMAARMVIGWNLGNTLDAGSAAGLAAETSWGMPKTTKDMIDAVKAAGFQTIRIPVSWSTHVSGSNYTIDSAWMNRVKEVVDYAVANDMYIILNVHHDNYSEADISSKSGFCITTNSTYQTKSKNYLDKVWTQIATKFADYDEKLIFEVLNEPRAVGTAWEWGFYSSTAKEKAPALCAVITDYEKTCISAIRAVPGNEDRFLMVPGYAASGADPSMLDYYKMPDNDTATDKLILSTHAYSPFNFAMGNSDKTFGSDDQSSLDTIFNNLKTKYTSKGIGVVMGEASASNKGNDAERIKWAKYYFGKAKDAGIPVVLWDNMVFTEDGHENVSGGYNGEHHGWLCRKKGTWYFPEIIKAMMDTVGVTGYSIPAYVPVTPESIGWNESAAITVYTGSLNTEWSAYPLDKSNFSGAKAGSILKISCTSAGGGNIRMINGSWSVIYNKGEIINATEGGDNFNVAGGNVDVYYILTADDASAWKANGFGIVGPSLTITSIKFMN